MIFLACAAAAAPRVALPRCRSQQDIVPVRHHWQVGLDVLVLRGCARSVHLVPVAECTFDPDAVLGMHPMLCELPERRGPEALPDDLHIALVAALLRRHAGARAEPAAPQVPTTKLVIPLRVLQTPATPGAGGRGRCGGGGHLTVWVACAWGIYTITIYHLIILSVWEPDDRYIVIDIESRGYRHV